MASNITLSAGVRQNLLSLQNTSALSALTQNRLATGKKVNSALDNPTNFFTSQSLSNRASDLNSLLDSIGQAQKTLEAADKGLTSLTKLVESAKSIAKQALQSTKGTFTHDLTAANGTQAIVADTVRTTSSSTLAAVAGGLTGAQVATARITEGSIAGLANTETITVQFGAGATRTYTKAAALNAGAREFNTAADLQGLLVTDFGAPNVASAGGFLTVSGTDFTTNFTVGGNAVAGQIDTDAVGGSTLTLNDGTNTATLRYVTSGASAAAGTFTTITDLDAAVAASSVSGSINATDATGALQLDSAGSVTVGGTVGTALGFAATAYSTTNSAFNTTLNGLTGSLTIAVGSATAQTITFGVGQNRTRAALTTSLAAITGVGAAINGSNVIGFTGASSDTLTIGGTGSVLTGLGLTAAVTTPTTTLATANATRTSLQSDFNALLSQIDALAKDASYNGINLLYGDNLKVVFNETGSSSQTINGVKYDSTGLGLTAQATNAFQTDATIDTVITGIDTALSSLRTQASKFGSNLTTVQVRQDFTKNLVNTLQTGADNLVLADSNEEGANLLALQTRQQLSSTALSLSAQADQAVLRLFG
jgi:flagellin